MSDFIKDMEGGGGEVRLSHTVFQNMAIFDRKVVFISLVDPTISRYNRCDIIVKNRNFAESMAEFFEQSWSKSFTAEEFKKNTGSNKDNWRKEAKVKNHIKILIVIIITAASQLIYSQAIHGNRLEKAKFLLHKPGENETVTDPKFKTGTAENQRFL